MARMEDHRRSLDRAFGRRHGDHFADLTLCRPRGCLVQRTGVRSRQQNLIKSRGEETCDAVGTRREDGHQGSG